MKKYYCLCILSTLFSVCFGAITKLDSLHSTNDTLNKKEIEIRKNQIYLSPSYSLLNYTRIFFNKNKNNYGLNFAYGTYWGEGGGVQSFDISALYKKK